MVRVNRGSLRSSQTIRSQHRELVYQALSQGEGRGAGDCSYSGMFPEAVPIS